ncbi:hypothetical protein GLYMA_16G138602v4 [Glycine max]|nr:hypothetical protein GLYMA_16G138602v4 [Glycine max]
MIPQAKQNRPRTPPRRRFTPPWMPPHQRLTPSWMPPHRRLTPPWMPPHRRLNPPWMPLHRPLMLLRRSPGLLLHGLMTKFPVAWGSERKNQWHKRSMKRPRLIK